ncbi:MAG TPA: hypothetical protein VE309_02010 [Caulobacteraceae bacterium]|nr:hypothetical protein [Caulobacteraceae bacterium]
MTTARKPAPEAAQTTHPVRPQPGKLDIAAMHDAIAKRFPKVLAELAK